MKKSVLIATCAAAIALPSTLSAQEVLDRARDAVENTAESTARSAEEAFDRTVEAAENTGQRAAQAIDNAADNARAEAENTFNATVDEGRQELRDLESEAQLRNENQLRSENQWQDSDPARNNSQLQPQMDNRYRSGYRGELQNANTGQHGWNQGMASNPAVTDGRVYVLRHDRFGREFICVNGQAVYFDNQGTSSAAQQSSDSNRYRAGYGSYDAQGERTETSSHTRFDATGVAPATDESTDSQIRTEDEANVDSPTDDNRANIDAEARLNETGADANLDARTRDSRQGQTLDAEVDADTNIDNNSEINADAEIKTDANLETNRNATDDLNLEAETDVDIDTEL